jgi:hypothetical protein
MILLIDNLSGYMLHMIPAERNHGVYVGVYDC